MTADPSWQRIRKVRTHEHVLAQIEQKILDGDLRVGERLPSERDLTEALGVSRASVREGLRALEAMGIIESHIGSGPDSGSFVSGKSNEALGNLLRLHMTLAQIPLADLIEVRSQLEQSAARRAATVHSQDDVEHLLALVAKMRSTALTYEQFNELDTEFHVSVARASRNALAIDLMQALRDAVKHEMTATFAELPDWQSVAQQLVVEHEQLVRAIHHNDAELAAKLVGDHIEHFYRDQLSGPDN